MKTHIKAVPKHKVGGYFIIRGTKKLRPYRAGNAYTGQYRFIPTDGKVYANWEAGRWARGSFEDYIYTFEFLTPAQVMELALLGLL